MAEAIVISNGVSVMSECYDCMTIADYDVKCRVCDESAEARVDEMAWNLRADERLAEGDVITDLSEQPVASDWVGSKTITRDGRVREEFTPSTYNLADRCPSTYFLGKHLFDLDDDEVRSTIHMYEKVCPKCNLVYPKRSGCQECR